MSSYSFLGSVGALNEIINSIKMYIDTERAKGLILLTLNNTVFWEILKETQTSRAVYFNGRLAKLYQHDNKLYQHDDFKKATQPLEKQFKLL